MKKVLQSVAVVATMLFATNASAQLPDNGVYPGGLVLDSYVPSAGYGGNHVYTMGSWDIDSILDTGTPVILDLFATWCSPCWSYHNGGTLEDLYDSEGWGAPTNNVAIFAVEADASTAALKLEGGDAGDWITNTKYPMVNHDQVAAMMNLAYYPTIIMICPDRSVSEVGQVTEAAFITALEGCSPAATAVNDPRILANNSVDNTISCGTGSGNAEIIVGIQNYSTAAINATYTVKLFDGATELASTDVVLNLAAYAAQNVTIGTIAIPEGVNNYTAKITTANDNLANDEIAIVIEGVVAQDMYTHDGEVKLEMNADGYASEIGVVFHNGMPTENLVSTYNNGAGSLGYMTIGTVADGAPFAPLTYTVDAAFGCHYFAFVDSYGDGIVFSNAGGNATISTTAGSSVVVPGNWDDGKFVVVNFISSAGVESATIENLSIYPNPASDVANVSLTLTEVSNVSISLVNTLGQTVYNTELGNVNGSQTVQINTSNLETGMYLVNTTVNGVVSTDRISIVK